MKKAIRWTRGERVAGWSVLAGVFALAVVTLWATFTETRPRDLEAGSDVVLPLAKLKTNRLFLFRYHIDGSNLVPVALQKGPDGMIRAAFATCRRCFTSRNYESSGQLVCGHCRHVMRMPDPRTNSGAQKSGCALPSLEYAVESGRVFVRAATIESEFSSQFQTGR